MARIAGFVRALQTHHHELTDEEGVAIIQHYSGEIDTPTWLIDFTWDPFVALFFASDGGKPGDIGKISYLGMGEWTRFSAGGANRLGSVRVIEPKGVPRIEAQQALFLDTSHPDLLDQFVPFSLYFRQTPGMVFEDTTRDRPVARPVLYPEGDPYKEQLVGASPQPAAKPLDYVPASDASVQLDEHDYLQLVESWYRHDKVELTSAPKELLRQVCMVYNTMQAPEAREMIEITARSLHRLEEAVRRVQVLGVGSLEEALESWVNRSMDSMSQETIAALIRRVTEETSSIKGANPTSAVSGVKKNVIGCEPGRRDVSH